MASNMRSVEVEEPLSGEPQGGKKNMPGIAALIGVGVVLLGGGYVLLGRDGGPAPTPAPTPASFTFPPLEITTFWNRGSGEAFPGYIGCFTDIVENRSLPHQAMSGGATAPLCNAACLEGGYKFFGLQYAGECFCGNGPYIGDQADGNECNMPCVADPQTTCGAGGRNSVYNVQTEAPPVCGDCGCLDEDRNAVLCVLVQPTNTGGQRGDVTMSLFLGDSEGNSKAQYGHVTVPIDGMATERVAIALYSNDLANFPDGVVRVFFEEGSDGGGATQLEGLFTKAGVMISTAECPGSRGHYCQANECCPGIQATAGQTFPCPISKLSETTCEAPDPKTAVLEALMAHMTRDEKHRFLRGTGNFGAYGYYIGNSGRQQRFGVPTVNMQDSGNGFRNDYMGAGDMEKFIRGPALVTSYPCTLALGSLWSEEHMINYGTVLGKEYRRKGANMILGPAVNVHRVPRNGRNAEYISGESPYLGARLTKKFVRAIQAQKVLSSVKHFINNNQETCRHETNAITDARTRFELYYPPFEAAIQADVAAQMCGYNYVNGELNCESKQIMQVELKDMLGFKGWVQSDWWALRNFTAAIDSGIDQEMPGGDYFTWERLHTLTAENVDGKVKPQLDLMLKYGLFEVVAGESCLTGDGCENYLYSNPTPTQESRDLSKEVATKAVMLLKNDDKTLPLKSDITKIALLGSACHKLVSMKRQVTDWQMTSYYFIGGSGRIIAKDPVTIYEGLQEKCPGGVDRSYVGCYWDDENDRTFDFKADGTSFTPATCRTECASYTHFGLQFGGECFCGNSIEKGVLAVKGECHMPCTAEPESFCGDSGVNSVFTVADPGPTTGDCEIVTQLSDDSAAAISKAAGADVAIICAGTSGTEDIDRVDLSVTEETFVTEVAANITDIPVVVLTMTPGTIVMPWINNVDAAMNLFLGGEFTGNAFASNLFGDNNPSAKSPIAYPVSEASTIAPCDPATRGLTCADANPDPCPYTEGLFIGWYNMTAEEILFPFGHGLSYTTFGYSNVAVHTAQQQITQECPVVDADWGAPILCVTATIENTGDVAGVEVAQLYMGYPESAEEPPRVLRGFNRLSELAPGATATARFPIYQRDTQVFSNANLQWEDVAGSFQLYIGTNSADTPLQSSFALPLPGRATTHV